MGRNLANIVLETHRTFTQYAQFARQADAALITMKERLNEYYRRAGICTRRISLPSIQAVRLIDMLLPNPGAVGIRQSVNIAHPGDHAHTHEYYLAKTGDKDSFYLFKFYDDERRWTRRYDPYNTKLHQRYSILSARGQDAGFDGLPSASANHYSCTMPLGETHLNIDVREELVRAFSGDYWHFNKSGEPVISAIITTDGKTTQPYDTLHLLETIYEVGGIKCPEKMQDYMKNLEQQKTAGAIRPARQGQALQRQRQP